MEDKALRSTVMLEGCYSPPAYVIGPKSFLHDRFRPDCDIMVLPGRTYDGGSFDVFISEGAISAENRGMLDRIRSYGARRRPARALDGIAFNACFYSPSNWAHFLCYHIPLFIAACQKMNLKTGDVPIVFPKDIPKYITDACSHLGIRWMLVDGKIEGRLLNIGRFEYSDIRAFRRKKIEESGFFPLKKQKDGTRSFEGVKAFISRQGARSLVNDAEVAELLEKHGYETFHPEKMAVADQFSLFEGARQIVGVSGAGLAPILMASLKPEDAFILELIPPGLANTFYKVIAEQQGLYWIGVRGMIKKDYIPEIYDMERSHYSKRINDSFEVCLASLELALSMAKARLSPEHVQNPR